MARPYNTGIRKGRLIDWTPDRVDKLRELHAAGTPPAKIIDHFPGATRNVIIGKLNRLGLGKSNPRRVQGQPSKAKEPKPIAISRPGGNPIAFLQKTEGVPFVEPDMQGDVKPLHSRIYADTEPGMCMWPLYYEGNVQMYCAAETGSKRVTYCECHHKVSTSRRTEPKPKNHGYVPISRFR